MTRVITLIAGACLLADPAPAETEQAHPLATRQSFKLDAETGCYLHEGTAAEFIGKFKHGSYISVTVDDPERIPIMDAPEFKTSDKTFWFGPLPQSREYSIVSTPAMPIRTLGKVIICGRTFAPGSPEEATHRDKLVQDMVNHDPNTRDVLKEPRVHPAE